MSALFPNPPRSQEELDRRHRVAMAFMGVGAPDTTPITPPPDPRLSFWAPLLSSLVPTIAGDPSFTFTRSTLATAIGPNATGNAADGTQVNIAAIGEARFQGARRIGAGNWAATYADGSAIPLTNLLGVVIEWPATNLLYPSQDFTNAAYVKTNLTVTPDSTTAPDGTLTADTLTATGALATFLVTAAANTYIESIFLKRKTGTGSIAIVMNGVFTDIDAQINSATWTRVSAIGAVGAGTTIGLRISTLGDEVYAWGIQLETKADSTHLLPTSYIPTTTVAVSRAQDNLRYPMTGNFGANPGSAYIEATYQDVSYGQQYPTLIHLITAGVAPLYFNVSTGGQQLRCLPVSGAGSEVITPNNRFAAGIVNKQASAWNSPTASACLNGAAVGVSASGFSPYVNSGLFAVGGDDSAHYACGYFRNVRMYNARLTDAELQGLTT